MKRLIHENLVYPSHIFPSTQQLLILWMKPGHPFTEMTAAGALRDHTHYPDFHLGLGHHGPILSAV